MQKKMGCEVCREPQKENHRAGPAMRNEGLPRRQLGREGGFWGGFRDRGGGTCGALVEAPRSAGVVGAVVCPADLPVSSFFPAGRKAH